MSRRLEKFIQDNRDDFDSDDMTTNIWDKIESDLNTKKKLRIFKMNHTWWAAAAVITALIAGGILYSSSNKNNSQKNNSSSNALLHRDVAADSNYSYQLYQFAHLIEIKQTELKGIAGKHPDLYKQFIKDINSLDSSFSSLRSALPANPNKEILMEEMVKNLQLQINLLNRQLQIIKQLKQKTSDYESKTI